MPVKVTQQCFLVLLVSVFCLEWLQEWQAIVICYHLLSLLLGSPDDLRSPLVPLVWVIALYELACWVAKR